MHAIGHGAIHREKVVEGPNEGFTIEPGGEFAHMVAMAASARNGKVISDEAAVSRVDQPPLEIGSQTASICQPFWNGAGSM